MQEPAASASALLLKIMSSHSQKRSDSKAADTRKSVHLSASAGSGKTRALKDRYLALLDVLDNQGLNIDQAVAITFTDKAAAEIKERVMQDLPETMLKKIIRGKQDLRISTIHSFCMNLLKRYPLEAGLPPDFGVLDARDQAYMIQRAIGDTLEESGRDPDLMSPLGNLTADELVSTIEYFMAIRSKLKRLEIDAGGSDNLLRSIRAGMGTARHESELQALVADADWRASCRRMESILRDQGEWYGRSKGAEHLLLADATEAKSVCRISASLAPCYFTAEGGPRKNPFIAKKAFTGPSRAGYERAYFALQEMMGRLRDLSGRIEAGREALSLLRLFQRAEEQYQRLKLRGGLLDFDDLEIYAYHLLQGLESPDILYWLDRKILHFLVDEFQDTSDIQWAILNKLTEEIFAGQGADKRMSPTLFVVGDEKQSIYRFREANYRLIEDVRNKMADNIPSESREILTLDRNFRSTPEVVEIVNRVFSALWGESYKPSEAERGDRGSVRLIELSPETTDEAETLANEITSLIENRTPVYEKTATGAGGVHGGWLERDADYGDCAVLIQSRTKLKEYEAALQARNIPYRVVGGIGFYEEDEVQSLINLLFFLWNRDDKLALVGALKSPLFALTDQDIFDLHAGEQDMIAALNKHHPAVWSLLNKWTGFAGVAPLSTLLHEIVEETGAYVRFGRRTPQAIFNIDKLLDTAREFDRRGYTTLQDFVEWVKNIRRTEQREATSDMNLPGFAGSVSILTVHKAKGLEYPVVFLPGMNQQSRSLSAGPAAIVDDGKTGVRIAVKNTAGPDYDELWEQERGELLREHQRMLYVAMTRARDHLVMIGALANGKSSVKPDTWLGYLHAAAPPVLFANPVEAGPGATVYAYPPDAVKPAGKRIHPETHHDREKKPAAADIDVETIIGNLSPLQRSEMLEWKSATDFIHKGKEESIGDMIVQAGVRSLSPITRGSVLHRCLEDFTKSGFYDIERIIMEYSDIPAPGNEIHDAFVSDVTAVLDRVLSRKEFAWIFAKQPDAYSELPFLYRKGRAIVSGIIDRVVIRANTGYVVDYKAIAIENDEALAAWKDHYRPQIEVYCEAVKEIFQTSSVEGSLLFLDSMRLELTTKV
jgi:ATP-dependent helicase/nuclease subunit A